MSGNKDLPRGIEVEARLLTGNEVARILNISRSFAFQLMRRGEIPVIRLSRCVRVRREDLETYIISKLTG